MAESGQMTEFQRRGLRLLLFLVAIHSIPVIWLTPVVGGTAPAVALLAFGIASLFTYESEGIGLGLMVLIPGLIYTGLAWLLAWLFAKGLALLTRTFRLMLTSFAVLMPLLSVYFPIYFAGGHSSSSSANLLELFSDYLSSSVTVSYWIAFNVTTALLYASQFLTSHSPRLALAEHLGGRALKFSALTLAGVIVYSNYPIVVCRPLAELGYDAAQLCVARSSSLQARYWYERASADGNAEATMWLIENTPNRSERLVWLTRGAETGDPAIQFQLARHLQEYGGAATAETDADKWLEASAANNYGPAQMQLAERLTREVLSSQSPDLLRQHNALLEHAAANDSQLARLRLAEYYTRGSMGYPADLEQARDYYEQLLSADDAEVVEREYGMNRASYQEKLRQLDAWRLGLQAGDPHVTLELARLYLTSPIPGPGVRTRGMQLFERIASEDSAARQELIVMLRTGTDGADKDLAAAREWLLTAARAGDVEAMDRVASNYLKGAEGFPLDYPEARSWIDALIDHYRSSDDLKADAHIASLKRHLKYIDRLGETAGGSLLGESELETLAQNSDADSHYNYALQLLAGHGSERRDEAVSRLQQAAGLGHADAAWRLVEIYERGFQSEINPGAARRELERAAQLHHFYAMRELASRYEYGKKGYSQDLSKAIAMYETALEAGRDNRYGWNLDPENYNHYSWLESRLRQAKLKLAAL